MRGYIPSPHARVSRAAAKTPPPSPGASARAPRRAPLARPHPRPRVARTPPRSASSALPLIFPGFRAGRKKERLGSGLGLVKQSRTRSRPPDAREALSILDDVLDARARRDVAFRRLRAGAQAAAHRRRDRRRRRRLDRDQGVSGPRLVCARVRALGSPRRGVGQDVQERPPSAAQGRLHAQRHALARGHARFPRRAGRGGVRRRVRARASARGQGHPDAEVADAAFDDLTNEWTVTLADGRSVRAAPHRRLRRPRRAQTRRAAFDASRGSPARCSTPRITSTARGSTQAPSSSARELRRGDRRRPRARRGPRHDVRPSDPDWVFPPERRVRAVPSSAAAAGTPRCTAHPREAHVQAQVRRAAAIHLEPKNLPEPPNRRQRRVLPPRVPRRNRGGQGGVASVDGDVVLRDGSSGSTGGVCAPVRRRDEDVAPPVLGQAPGRR